MSTIHTTVIDELPKRLAKSARESVCQEVVDLAVKQTPKFVKVDADTTEDLTKFYKSMIQYRSRHKDRLNIGLRKSGDEVFVWVEEPKAGADA